MSAIPPNVYWNDDASNFYKFPAAHGMGDEFYREWINRRHEFPTGPHAASWCTRYRSAGTHDTCLAGVPFDKWSKTPFGQRPCFLTDDAQSKPDAVACESLRRPTVTEIEMWRTGMHAGLVKLFNALAVTADWRDANAGRAASTSLACPNCKTKMHVAITKSGKMMGQCETPDCTKWIE